MNDTKTIAVSAPRNVWKATKPKGKASIANPDERAALMIEMGFDHFTGKSGSSPSAREIDMSIEFFRERGKKWSTKNLIVNSELCEALDVESKKIGIPMDEFAGMCMNCGELAWMIQIQKELYAIITAQTKANGIGIMFPSTWRRRHAFMCNIVGLGKFFLPRAYEGFPIVYRRFFPESFKFRALTPTKAQ